MIVLKKTAALVAVFFMLITGGCYTKLKHPEPVLIPDNQAISESGYDWDFSHGWRGSHWGQYDKYKGYYITQWWYDCPWRGDIIGDIHHISLLICFFKNQWGILQSISDPPPPAVSSAHRATSRVHRGPYRPHR